MTSRAARKCGRASMAMAPSSASRAGSGSRRNGRGFTEIDYFGQPLRLLQNPASEREIAGFLNRTKYKAARRIVDPTTGDVYLWDAADPALHKFVAESMGVPWGPKTQADMIGIEDISR